MSKLFSPKKQFQLAPTTAQHVIVSGPDQTYDHVLLSDITDPLTNLAKNAIVDETYDVIELTQQDIDQDNVQITLTAEVKGTYPLRRLCDANGQFGINAPSTATLVANTDPNAPDAYLVTITGFAGELSAEQTLGLKCCWKAVPNS